MSPACKKPENDTRFPIVYSNTAPAIKASEVNLSGDDQRAVPLEPVADQPPIEVAPGRVGSIVEEPKNKTRTIALISTLVTLLVVTLAQILGELIKATPAFQQLRDLCSKIDISGVADLIRSLF